MAENTTHYRLNLDDFLWVLGFPLSMLNRQQRKTTLLDWHCSACSLFLKLSTVKKTTKRLTGGFNVLFNTDQRCWIFKTSLAFELYDVSQFCRLFFCSQVCHAVQWCLYLIVPFWYASAAYQASLVEPWFVFWRDAVEPKYPWWDQTSLICCQSVPKRYDYIFTIPKFVVRPGDIF